MYSLKGDVIMGRLLKVSFGTVIAVILTFVIWLFGGEVWCIIFVSALAAGSFIYLFTERPAQTAFCDKKRRVRAG